MKPKRQILFISHDATLTGAPILLLNLIRLIKEETDYSCKIIIKDGSGTLIQEFESVAQLLVWKKPKYNMNMYSFKRFTIRYWFNFFTPKKSVDIDIQKWIDESDVIISNTITNGDFLKHFKFSENKLVISYIHELEIATDFYSNKQDLSSLKDASNLYIVPSKAVANHLIQNVGITLSSIKYLNYYIPRTNGNEIATKKIISEKFSVGIVGTLDWRKGADIFSIIVATFFKKYGELNLKFYWKGVNLNSIEYKRVAYELEKLGLSDKIVFLEPTKDVSSFYQSIDLFLLISKEDPYPLVVLEAASYSIPSICFANVGGAEEFVEEDAGSVIPFLDIDCLTNEIYFYYSHKEICLEKGNNAYNKYNILHRDKQKILKQFINIIGE